jgi:glutathione peroxidase
MKNIVFPLLAFIVFLTAQPLWSEEVGKADTFFDLSARSIDGSDIEFQGYRGKVLLVVNTASKCGFTPQYEGLEEIYKKYREQGFEVLAFPSNDFMQQEPGSNEEIKSFCKTTYDVTFPLFARGAVTGGDKQPVFRFLTENAGSDLNGEVRWNFEKFLIGRDGRLVERFRSFTSPTSGKVVAAIERLLGQQAVTEHLNADSGN